MTNLLLWVDLETTGLDHHFDSIIEAAWALTTTDLVPVAARTTIPDGATSQGNNPPIRSMVMPITDTDAMRIYSNNNVRAMHEASGLLSKVTDISTTSPYRWINPDHKHTQLEILDNWIADTIDAAKPRGKADIGPDTTVHLAGSGVAEFDRPFINRDLPNTASRLHYRSIDVGIIRRAHQMWSNTDLPSDINDAKTHRAYDDIACHIAEAHAFKNLWTT